MMNLYKAGEVDAIYNHIVAGRLARSSAPDERLHGRAGERDRVLHVQHDEAADERRPRAQGVQHGDRQGGAGRVPARRQAAHGVHARRHLPRLPAADGRSVRSGARASSCWPRPATATPTAITIRRSSRSPTSSSPTTRPNATGRLPSSCRRSGSRTSASPCRSRTWSGRRSWTTAPSSNTRASRERAGSATTWIRSRSSISSRRDRRQRHRAGPIQKYRRRCWTTANRAAGSAEALRAAGAGREDAARRAAGDSARTRSSTELDEEAVRERHVSESRYAARLEVRLHRARSRQVGLRRRSDD